MTNDKGERITTVLKVICPGCRNEAEYSFFDGVLECLHHTNARYQSFRTIPAFVWQALDIALLSPDPPW